MAGAPVKVSEQRESVVLPALASGLAPPRGDTPAPAATGPRIREMAWREMDQPVAIHAWDILAA